MCALQGGSSSLEYKHLPTVILLALYDLIISQVLCPLVLHLGPWSAAVRKLFLLYHPAYRHRQTYLCVPQAAMGPVDVNHDSAFGLLSWRLLGGLAA